jgi:hypothetical protein
MASPDATSDAAWARRGDPAGRRLHAVARHISPVEPAINRQPCSSGCEGQLKGTVAIITGKELEGIEGGQAPRGWTRALGGGVVE